MQPIIGHMKKVAREILAENLTRLMREHPDLGSQVKLSRKSGVGQSTISRIRRAEVSVSAENVEAIARAFGITASQILSPGMQVSSNAQPAEHLGELPLISWGDAAAWRTEMEDIKNKAVSWVNIPFEHGPRAFVLRVTGESNFDPTSRKSYADGDFIAVDPDRQPAHGSMVVVRTGDGEVLFKQLILDGTVRFLKALNPAWPHRIIEMGADAEIVGVVIGKWVTE